MVRYCKSVSSTGFCTVTTRSVWFSLPITLSLSTHSTTRFRRPQHPSSSCVISNRSSLIHSRLLTSWHQRGYSHEHAAENPAGLLLIPHTFAHSTKESKESLSESELSSGWIILSSS